MRIRVSIFLILLSFSSLINAASEDVVASFNGEPITYQMIEQGSEMELYEAKLKLFDIRMTSLKEMLIGRLIKLDPRSKGLDQQQFINRYIAKPIRVTDKMVSDFAKKQRIPADKLDQDLKSKVRQYLRSQNYMSQVDAWFVAQSGRHNVKINLTMPEEPRFHVDITDAPFRGDKNAKVTIVEFSDFECPYCVRADGTVRQLVEKYGDKIKVVYKHFPLSFHPNAPKAAEASICAQQQGMDYFWKMHDELFANYRNLSVGVMKDSAKKIGLDYDAFSSCLTSGKYASRVEADMQQGMAVGVNSTPVFFVNGRLIKGAQPLESFVEKIEQELAK